MAAEDKIDSVIDQPAIRAEFEFLKGEITEAIAAIKSAKQQSIDFNVNTKSFDDLKKNSDALNESLKKVQDSVGGVTSAVNNSTKAMERDNATLVKMIELRNKMQTSMNSYIKQQKDELKLYREGILSKSEYNKRNTEASIKIDTYRAKLGVLNKEIKQEILNTGQGSSAYKLFAKQVQEAQIQAQNYAVALGKTHPQTLLAVKNAKALSNELKEIDSAVGINVRNVGNYGSALDKVLKPFRTLANILPGLGLSGIFLLLGEGIAWLGDKISGLSKVQDLATRSAKYFADAQAEAAKSSASEISELDALVAIAKDETATRESRNLAVSRLQEMYPNYLKNIGLETINSKEAAAAIDEVREALLQKGIAQAYVGKIADLVMRQTELQNGIDKTNNQLLKNRENLLIAVGKEGDRYLKAGQSGEVGAIRTENIKLNNALQSQHKEWIQVSEDLALVREGYNKAYAASILLTKPPKEPKSKAAKKVKDDAEDRRKALFEALKDDLQLEIEMQELIANNEKRSLVDRSSAQLKAGLAQRALIEAQADYELGTAKLTSEERQQIENHKVNEIVRLNAELGKKLKAIFDSEDFKVDTKKIAEGVKGIGAAYSQIYERLKKETKELGDKVAENQKKIRDTLIKLSSEIQGLFFDMFTNGIENQKNEIQGLIDQLEAQKQKDIEVANQTITNAQEKADAIVVIEARAAAERNQLELKQRELDQQKARWEKARSIAEITQSTALAVANALTQVKTLGPGAIVLASLIGALGAVQIARIVAQPIPKYAEGTDNHPGGLAWVGDGGRSEGVRLPDGTLYKTPNTPTLVDLPAGTKVYSDFDNMHSDPTVVVKQDMSDIRVGLKEIVKAIHNIPETHVHAEGIWKTSMKKGSSFTTYLNKRI